LIVSASQARKIIPGESLKKLGEFGLIDLLRKRMKPSNPGVIMGIGDDAAVLRPQAGFDLVLTTDMLVEGRHFDFKTTRPRSLGAKTMAVNLSDCAAMGARPLSAVVSVGLPAKFPASKVKAFYDGLNACGKNFGVDIVGGDTVRSDAFVVNVALLGQVEKGRALTRSGAKVGDVILVTGMLGDSAAGLHSLRHPGKKAAVVRPLLEKKHLTPVPRVRAGRFLVEERLASSCIDVSDGLSSEVNHLAKESGVGAEVHEEALPLSTALLDYCEENRLSPLTFSLSGGEDYELLFTAPLSALGAILRRMPAETGCPVKPVGRIVPKKKGVRLIGARGVQRPLRSRGYDHFA
jgi:thiamine-monophosphate kinase